MDKKGSIYTFTTSTDLKFTNFIKHAIFVPTILRITELCEQQNNLSYQIGRDNIIKSPINISKRFLNVDDSFLLSNKTNFIIPCITA